MRKLKWNPILKQYQEELRSRPTWAEKQFRRLLRTYCVANDYTYVFQFIFEINHRTGYIADFALPEKKLIIEIDGGYHFTPEQQEYDLKRTKYFEKKKWHVLRFTNEDTNDRELCLNRLTEKIATIKGRTKIKRFKRKKKSNGRKSIESKTKVVEFRKVVITRKSDGTEKRRIVT